MRRDGPQVRVESERLANREQPLLRPHLRARVVPLGATNGAEQHGVRALAHRRRVVGKRRAGRVDRRAADQPFLERHRHTRQLRGRDEHALGLCDDLRTDPVAGQQCDRIALLPGHAHAAAAAPRVLNVDGRVDSYFSTSGAVFEQEAHLVDAVQQAVLGERRHGERHRLAVRQRECAGLEIHRHTRARRVRRHQLRQDFRLDLDRQQAVAQRVAAEDVGEGAAHDGAEPRARKSPHRVLARGAASEVVAGHEHLRALRLWLVEHEVGIRRSVGEVAPVVECVRAEALTIGRREKARRDDLVGVDVLARQHDVRRAEVPLVSLFVSVIRRPRAGCGDR